MSKESYRAGFCKKAAAHNIDPQALARFAVQKAAADAPAAPAGGAAGAGANPGVWQKVLEAIEKVKAAAGRATGKSLAWLDEHPTAKVLAGAGVGSAVGTGIGAALAGKKGLRAGAILGAIGGAGNSVDWNVLAQTLGKLKTDARNQTQEQPVAKA